MDHQESMRRIREALDGRPLTWLAKRIGYGSTDYVSKILRGREPATPTFYEDVAAVLRVQPREITPTSFIVTFARPGSRIQRAI